MEEGEPIEHRMVTRAIERAQKQVEGRNFEIRKHLLEYDDVMNKQRKAIYELRRDILDGNEGRDYVLRVADDLLGYVIEQHCPEKADPRDWELTEVRTDMVAYFNLDVGELGVDLDELGIDELGDTLREAVHARYEAKEQRLGSELMRSSSATSCCRSSTSRGRTTCWRSTTSRRASACAATASATRKIEYKRESFELFQAMKERIEDSLIKTLFRLEPLSEEQLAERRQQKGRQSSERLRFSAPPKTSAPQRPQTVKRGDKKVGRNDPCPCGSGKKYKKCHGSPAGVTA